MRIFSICFCLLTGITAVLYGQKRDCQTDQYFESQIKADPTMMDNVESIEAHTKEMEKAISNRNTNIITIPVVVHIVYNDASENISADQVMTQLDVLNKDFRRKNTDITNIWPQAADAEMEFCLASTDPMGNPTNGITRTFTPYTSFASSGDNVKFSNKGGKDAWPSDRYLNIWVCDLTGTVVGYAQFPGGKAETDGVVVDYKAFGTGTHLTAGFQLGRTTTHEIGHWLNLRHIWGASDCITDDLVADTPTADAPNYGCAKGHWSCGSLDMVENYMDYSDDHCMNLFTSGQKARMSALFMPGGYRHSIIYSNGCQTPPPVLPCSKLKLEITFDNYPQETSWVIKNGKEVNVLSSPKYNSTQRAATVNIDTCLSPECYTFNIFDSYGDGICCKYGKGSYRIFLNETLIASGDVFGKSISHPFCIEELKATCDDNVKNGMETGIDCGGPACPPCPTCADGVKNGNESDIDCGGPDCAPCKHPDDPGTGGSLIASFFESGWDGWTGGNMDTERYKGDYSWEGDYSIMIRDDSGDESAMTSQEVDLRPYKTIKIAFSFFAYSMEKGEDFWLMYHDGTKWHTIKAFVSETDFYNNNFYEVTYYIHSTSYNFGPKGKFRFQCDASTNADQIYIDAVKITGITQSSRETSYHNQVSTAGHYLGNSDESQNTLMLSLHPNPAFDIVTITSDSEISSVKIVDMMGKEIVEYRVHAEEVKLDISKINAGMYLAYITTEYGIISKRLVKK